MSLQALCHHPSADVGGTPHEKRPQNVQKIGRPLLLEPTGEHEHSHTKDRCPHEAGDFLFVPCGKDQRIIDLAKFREILVFINFFGQFRDDDLPDDLGG